MLWIRYGRREAIIQFILTGLFLIFWTIVAVAVPADVRFIYVYPFHWWRVVFLLLAIGMTIYTILGEYREYRAGKRNLQQYQEQGFHSNAMR